MGETVTAYEDIRVSEPYDVPDIWREEETLPNGVVVPAHLFDMSGWFEIRAEVPHEGHVHGYTMQGVKATYAGWPELMDKAVKSIRDQVWRAVEDCEKFAGIAHDMGKDWP